MLYLDDDPACRGSPPFPMECERSDDRQNNYHAEVVSQSEQPTSSRMSETQDESYLGKEQDWFLQTRPETKDSSLVAFAETDIFGMTGVSEMTMSPALPMSRVAALSGDGYRPGHIIIDEERIGSSMLDQSGLQVNIEHVASARVDDQYCIAPAMGYTALTHGYSSPFPVGFTSSNSAHGAQGLVGQYPYSNEPNNGQHYSLIGQIATGNVHPSQRPTDPWSHVRVAGSQQSPPYYNNPADDLVGHSDGYSTSEYNQDIYSSSNALTPVTSNNSFFVEGMRSSQWLGQTPSNPSDASRDLRRGSGNSINRMLLSPYDMRASEYQTVRQMPQSKSVRIDDLSVTDDAASTLDPTSPSPSITPSAGGTVYCHKCGVAIKGKYRKGNLQRHLRISHGSSSYLCEEEGCFKNYKRQDARLKHYRSKHPRLAKPASQIRAMRQRA